MIITNVKFKQSSIHLIDKQVMPQKNPLLKKKFYRSILDLQCCLISAIQQVSQLYIHILLTMQETSEMQVQSLGLEDLLQEGMATQSSILAWKIPWTEEPGGLQSIGSKRVTHNKRNLVQFSSVGQLCPTVCNPIDCSTTGLHVHHQLLEFTQTQVH